MGLLELLAAYAIAQGSHTGGHFYQASNPDNPMRDVTMKLDIKKLAETWDIEDKWSKSDTPVSMSHEDYLKDNIRKESDLSGSGFMMQDRVRDMMKGKSREDVSKMNAGIKLLYLTLIPEILKKTTDGDKGDIKDLQKSSGNKYVPHMVGLTALSDLMQKGDSKASLGFRVENGQPGVVFNYKW